MSSKTQIITVRVPNELYVELPKSSLRGWKTKFILEALQEKVDREKAKKAAMPQSRRVPTQVGRSTAA